VRVVAEGDLYHVQAGAFRNRRNAEQLAAALVRKGFGAMIAGGPEE
jgi:cell division protein FtsN